MLIITRRIGQRLVLKLPDGALVEVVVRDVSRRGDRAYIGIQAPADVGILREELLRDRIPPDEGRGGE